MNVLSNKKIFSALKAIWDHPLAAFFVYVAVPSLLVILAVNVLVPRPTVNTPQQRIALAIRTQDHREARDAYLELLKNNPQRIDYHRGYINSHFSIDKRTGKYALRNDEEIIRRYQEMTASPDTSIQDLGHYSLGLIAVLENDYNKGLEEYGKVTNGNLPYLNNSIGYAHLKLSQYVQAEEFFRKEMGSGIIVDSTRDNIRAAVNNLSDLYVRRGEVEKLNLLSKDDRYRTFLPSGALRYVSFRKADLTGYVTSYFRAHLANPNTYGIIAALFIAAIWFFYFVKLDVFEPEKYFHLLLALAAGAVASVGTSFVYDIYRFLFGFELGGSILRELSYCVLGIGLIEETVKIVPALLLYRFNKQVNEPLDLLIYGSLTALGFALMENIQYFHQAGLTRITGRAVTASLLHMSLTAIALYGLVLIRFFRKSNNWLVPVGTFALACLIHGLYDLFLVSQSWLSGIKVVSIVILLFTAMAYGHILNTCINRSPFFNQSLIPKLKNLSRYLAFGMCGVILLQYLVVALNYGPPRANRDIINVVISLYFIIWIVSMQLGNFRVKQGMDIPIFENQRKASI
jgi:RsiW-degrading membrane proteinase PrsW (M82 family)